MWETIKADIKNWWDSNKKKVFVSINLGFLLMGVFMIVAGINNPASGSIQNHSWISIGAVFVAIWFVLFPLVSRETKDKILQTIAVHFLIIILILSILTFEIHYFLTSCSGGKWYFDMLFGIAGVVIASYVVYVALWIVKTFFYLIRKAGQFLFPTVNEKVAAIIHAIEAVAALFASIVSLGSGIVGMIALAKQCIEWFF